MVVYRRSGVEGRALRGGRPLVEPRSVEERLHRRRVTSGLDGPNAAAAVDAEVPSSTTSSLGA